MDYQHPVCIVRDMRWLIFHVKLLRLDGCVALPPQLR